MASRREEKVDYILKFVLIGSSGVGKTSIVNQFLGKGFMENVQTTLAVPVYEKIITFKDSNKQVKVKIQDTAGEERFVEAMTSTYFRGVHSVILVYDITNRDSFDALDLWRELYKRYSPDNVFVILIGNKSDCTTERKVTTDDGVAYANNNDQMMFMETSAKNDVNIEQVFKVVAEGACRLIDESRFQNTLDMETSLPSSRGSDYTCNIVLGHDDDRRTQSKCVIKRKC